MITIHTPGHSPYTDTLIMYSIAYAAEDSLREVIGLGTSYALTIEGLTERQLAERLSTRFDIVREQFSTRLTRLVEERDVSASADALSRTEALASYLQTLVEPGHSQNEGRFGRGRNVKLPLMPSAGKYLRTDLTKEQKYQVKEYYVCPYCFALALMGLGVGTVSAAFRTTLVLSTLGFEGEVDGLNAARLVGAFEILRQGQNEVLQNVKADEVPDRILGALLLTCLDDRLLVRMHSSNASWKSYVVRFDVGRAVQIRGYSTVELDAVLAALAGLIRLEEEATASVEEGRGPPACRSRLTAFLASLLRARSTASLERLFDYLMTRDPTALYAAARDAYASTDGKVSMGAELAACLLSLAL